MNNRMLYETIADISYLAGQNKYFSGDSREDIFNIINWAKEFEKVNLRIDWDTNDYILIIEEFTLNKIKESQSSCKH